MIVLLEGVDGTGKSTLAQQLSDRLNVPVYNRPDNPLKGMSTDISQAMHTAELNALLLAEDVIIDRWWPSEYAYDKAFDRPFDEELLFHTDELLWRSGVPLVPVMLYFHSIEEFADRIVDDEIDVSMWPKIRNAYQDYVTRSHIRWIAINAAKSTNDTLEIVMRYIMEARPTKDVTFMNLAREMARRSTCLSRHTGAVLVSARGHVIATGFNGAPCNMAHPRECPRLTGGAAGGTLLDACNDVHAEENLIAQAALSGSTPEGGIVYTVNSPCHRCARMLINSKISEVVYDRKYGDDRAFDLFKEAGVKMRRFE